MRPQGSVPLRADPLELSRLAAATLDVSAALSDGWRSSVHLLTPGRGSSAGGEQVHRAATSAAAAAQTALRRMAEVFAADADRLWQTAFAYEEADERAQRRLDRRRPA